MEKYPNNSPFVRIFDEHRCWADLYRVSIVCRVFEQAVVRIEELAGQQEEEFTRWAAVIEPGIFSKQHRNNNLQKKSFFTFEHIQGSNIAKTFSEDNNNLVWRHC